MGVWQARGWIGVIALALGGCGALAAEAAGSDGLQSSAKVRAPRTGASSVGPSLREVAKRVRELRSAAAKRTRADSKGLTKTQRREAVERASRKGVGYSDALLHYLRERAYPRDTVDWSAWPRAATHRDAMPPARAPITEGIGAQAAGDHWDFIGPRDLSAPYRRYFGSAPLSGRVNAVVYDHTSPSTWYVGAAGGGVWKTTSSGDHWTCLSDDWEHMFVSSLALDPSDPSTIYVGTGDFDGAEGYAFGMMKSTDGGATWINLGRSSFGGAAISAIVVDPTYPSTVVAATGRGNASTGNVWRSEDGGQTWTPVLNCPGPCSDLEIGAPYPDGERCYYATHLKGGGGVYRSDDRGLTWNKLQAPFSSGAFSKHDCVEVACSTFDPETVYLLIGADYAVYRSSERGALGSWMDVSDGLMKGGSNWDQRWYDAHLTCSVRTDRGSPEDVLYLGLVTLSQKPGPGEPWRDIGKTQFGQALTHSDQHCMALHPTDPTRMLIGNDGGLSVLTLYPGVDGWSFDSTPNARLAITQFYRMSAHPTDANMVTGGTQDNATPVSLGHLDDWANRGGGDGGFTAMCPLNPDIQFVTSQNLGVYMTTSGWVGQGRDITPSIGTDRKAFIAPIAVDPSRTDVLYAGTNYLWRFIRSGEGGSWQPRLGGQELAHNGGYITYIAVAPSDPECIYTGAGNGELWVTRNGGSTFTRIDNGNPTSLPNRSITSIAVHPSDASSICVTLSGTGSSHAWRCPNTLAANRTWLDIGGTGTRGLPDIPTNSIALDPSDPLNVLYVATDIGVFTTIDGGGNWSNATGPLGLPNVHVSDLKVGGDNEYLFAATYGRGMWRMRLDPNGVVATEPSGGQAYEIGDPITIRWRYVGSPGATVRIELLRNGETDRVLAAAEPIGSGGMGSVVWTPPADLETGSRFRVRVSGSASVHYTDTTDADFTIKRRTTLAVLQPAGGESFEVGSRQWVIWSYTGSPGPQVNVELLLDGSYLRTIAAGADIGEYGIGSYLWTIPGNQVPSTRYRVRVMDTGNESLTATSATDFELRTGSAITVTWPDGGDYLSLQGAYTVMWEYAGSPGSEVRIELYLDGAMVHTIAESTPIGSGGAGSYGWTVPWYITPGSKYRVRVTSTSNEACWDESDGDFTIALVRTRTVLEDAAGAVGETVALTATLSDYAYGTPIVNRLIRFSVDGTEVGTGITGQDGQAVCAHYIAETPYITSHALDALFEGDSVFRISGDSARLQIGQAATNIFPFDAAGAPGQRIALSAALMRATDGGPVVGRWVWFRIGGNVVGGSTTDADGIVNAWCRLPEVLPGTIEIGAEFGGDVTYLGAYGAATLTTALVATDLSMEEHSAHRGDQAPISAVLARQSDSAPLAGRTIAFLLEGSGIGSAVADITGTATVEYAVGLTMPLGGYSLQADFAGDEYYTASSTAAELTVLPAATALAVADREVVAGAEVTLEAALRRTCDGVPLVGRTVTYLINNEEIGTAMTDGAGVSSLPFAGTEALGAGEHQIRAEFAGTPDEAPCSGVGVLTVTKSPVRMDILDRSGTIGETVILRAYLYRGGTSVPLAGRDIEFTIDGTPVGSSITEATGRASLAWIISDGPPTRTIGAFFPGDAAYATGAASATLAAQTHATKMSGANREGRITAYRIFKAWLYRLDNTPVVGKSITFKLDGTLLASDITRSTGLAQIGYTIADGAGAGVRTVLAEWAGDGGYLASSCTNTLTVYKATPHIWVMPRSVPQGGVARLYAYFRRLADYQKQAGKTVTFRIDGTWIADVVTLTGAEAGIARYYYTSVEAPGAHTIRCEFAGDAWVDAGYGEANLTVY